MAPARKRRELPPATVEALIVLFVLVLVVGGGLVGWVVGHEGTRAAVTTVTALPSTIATTSPPGHTGGVGLPPEAFGNPGTGAELFVDKGCSDCHSYNGQGGEDAPPLDYMKGHLSAAEIADMSGQIWDHLPEMIHHFEEEGLPYPTFKQGEMADLVAFLHSGKGKISLPPPSETGGEMSKETSTVADTGKPETQP